MLRNRNGQLRLRLDLSEIGISKILRLITRLKGGKHELRRFCSLLCFVKMFATISFELMPKEHKDHFVLEWFARHVFQIRQELILVWTLWL